MNKEQETKTVPDKSIFPTMGSIQEVIDLAESKLPITNKNELHSLLMTMSNTTIQNPVTTQAEKHLKLLQLLHPETRTD